MEIKYTEKDVNNLINKYVSKIESIETDIIKNYRDMDIDNVEINDKYDEIIERMLIKCERLKENLNYYRVG